MHAIAEAVWQARKQPDSYAMVTSNGGMLSKHATGIYSRQPGATDWANTDTTISSDDLDGRAICEDPRTGTIVSYTVHYNRDGSSHAVILGETDSGERFVSMTAKDDSETAAAMLSEDPTGKRVVVTPPEDERLDFQLA
jgi:acetyl-CoA C-acetyltransferase